MNESTSSSWRTGAGAKTGGGDRSVSSSASRRGRQRPTASAGKGLKNGGGEAKNGTPGPNSQKKVPASSTSSSLASASKGKVLPNLPSPFHNLAFLQEEYSDVLSSGQVKQQHIDNPKNILNNYVTTRAGAPAVFEKQEGYVGLRRDPSVRVTVLVDEQNSVVGYGDARTQKEAEKLSALHAVLQLARLDLLNAKPPPMTSSKKAAAGGENAKESAQTAQLSNGKAITIDRAREFIDYYCVKFKYGRPDIQLVQKTEKAGKKMLPGRWNAEMRIGGIKMGSGDGTSKKAATTNAFFDAVTYLESCDAKLWESFDTLYKPGSLVPGSMPEVKFTMPDDVDGEICRVYERTKQSLLFANRPRPAGDRQHGAGESGSGSEQARQTADNGDRSSNVSEEFLHKKSQTLMEQLQAYHVDDRMKKMRESRQSLPVIKRSSDVLVKIELNNITIIMASTGSGKTTQIPQILFDDYIMQGEGAKCNIFCTQPRRIAAISVAERVASERGESLGKSVGYQVRFDHKLPQPHGCITFCTTGIFLQRLRSALGDKDSSNTFLDSLTHIVLDEVHERNIETDLLLVVLKRLLTERKRAGKRAIKLVLMSATIDPKLFCDFFADPVTHLPAPVVEVSGRSFPVERHFLEEEYHHLDSLRLSQQAGGWVWGEKNVREYLDRELSPGAGMDPSPGEKASSVDDLELPYPLIALMIADVLKRSDEGHVLCFLPGWDEIKAVNTILEDTRNCPLMGINFNDRDRIEIHILHSNVPVVDQQAVFEPIRKEGIRRIILSTNIAETSVTIPDVVYVIDSGRAKESRYDPERHLSSLVSAWVGTSNINQRAGRAGRHRPGEAFAVFSKARYDRLAVNSTIEMNRVDLSNVAMHIKALAIPGMDVEDVLAAAIEPPATERVRAALDKLINVGALDASGDLTSLGRVLLQLPVDAPIGKMCLYGAFFRCLDPTLTLAAVLTNRDPWLSPITAKEEASAAKNSWSLPHFRSDPLCTLRAFSRWDALTSRGAHREASQFCTDNFLGRITLTNIRQVKQHLFQSMDKAGILDAIVGQEQEQQERGGGPGHSGGAHRRRFGRMPRYDPTMAELNTNASSAPMLAALIALASVPNFAVRTKERVYRTSQDKSCQIHPSSVQHLKHTKQEEEYQGERDLFAFSEKIKNMSQATGSGGPTNLRNVTRLDLLTYMLFGANQLRHSFDGGMVCDNWLPIKGKFDDLDDVERLKDILDVCMLRVFESISPENIGKDGDEDDEGKSEDDDDDDDDNNKNNNRSKKITKHRKNRRRNVSSKKRLVPREVREFQVLTQGVVGILDAFAKERIDSSGQSRGPTRPATPSGGGEASYVVPKSFLRSRGPTTRPATPSGDGAFHDRQGTGVAVPSSKFEGTAEASANSSGRSTPFSRSSRLERGSGGEGIGLQIFP